MKIELKYRHSDTHSTIIFSLHKILRILNIALYRFMGVVSSGKATAVAVAELHGLSAIFTYCRLPVSSNDAQMVRIYVWLCAVFVSIGGFLWGYDTGYNSIA